MGEKDYICPYCEQPMKKWTTPQLACWEAKYQFVCFNDDCPYYVKGWDWMRSQYNVNASYRHRYNPDTGEKGPIPVWSRDALRDGIVED